ncbi:electron transfer flavoprotein subunit beta/FixA family protein [Marinicrinis sediminis]|uniref:Electron transfer flavoprotein subunit beta n=1 Tax=Marinicrinis sediminis TaxID=1652465 RepID=A0ABW5REL1_9BACL
MRDQPLNIAVLIKQTFDTEEKIHIENGSLKEEGVKWIINPYDEYAIEQALLIREEHGGYVTVITAGPERTEEALRTALAMGADAAVRLIPPNAEMEPSVVSALLAAYCSDQSFDLIWAGHFSVDHGGGQVAIETACQLGMPHIGAVIHFQYEPNTGNVICKRDVEGDSEVISASLPVVCTAQQGLCEPRYPSLPNIMKARKKPLEVIDHTLLPLSEVQLKSRVRRRLLFPAPPHQAGVQVSGTPEEQVSQIIGVLQDIGQLSPSNQPRTEKEEREA